jgi:predicted MFS family arabinose efflux permease
MTANATTTTLDHAGRAGHAAGMAAQTVLIGLVSFLTFVDLFAAQAILPSLVAHYGVSPARMGFAVNASTIGMAAAGIGVALVGRRLNRRRGIWMSLALLSIPTALLASAPDLATFAALRVAQGVFMASSFALIIAYLAERSSAEQAAGALAACITGNVASNLVGRLASASITGVAGLEANFYTFAGLNILGAALVLAGLSRCTPMAAGAGMAASPLAVWAGHLRNRALRRTFALGFLILFVFIGTFTYVNFVLAQAPIGLSPMSLGLVYFVFLPSILTTPLAGRVARRLGARPTIWASLGVAGAALPLLLLPSLPAVLAGLVLMGVGTFFAQATATGFIGRAATGDRGAAGGIYLACYYLGGLAGAFVLGQVFDGFGWETCIIAIGAALVVAALQTAGLKLPERAA